MVDQSTSRPADQRPAALDIGQDLERLIRNYAAFAKRAKADRTVTEYAAQWRRFDAWCAVRGLNSLPCQPQTLALYLASLAERLKVASIAMALAAVCAKHRTAGHSDPQASPIIGELWAGIRRSLGSEQRRVAPLLTEDLHTIARAMPHTLAGKRDRALLALGLGGAMRRSELCALTVEDVKFQASGGLVLRIRRSKTDQEGKAARIGIARGGSRMTCPERNLRAWLEASRIKSGPLFRSVNGERIGRSALSGRTIANIIKRAVEAAGLDPELYSGHSLRAGLATSAARAGKADRAIMQQGRWSNRATVDRYVRDARLLDRDNASADIGL
jgi:integrase